MELLEKYRYSIYMKKGYKIVNIIFAIVAVAMVIATTMMVLEKGHTISVYIFRVLLVVFFIVLSFMQIMLIRKKVDIYKGKILYFNGFKTKAYKASEIYKSDTKVETSYMMSSGSKAIKAYDHVTTFYDSSGRKLFKFGSAFENVALLENEIKHTRKSVINSKKI